MQKKFILNIALLLSLNILIKPFWVLGIDRTVQNMAGTSDYGTYISLYNLSLLFHFLLDLGLSTYNNRQVAMDLIIFRKSMRSIVTIKSVLAVFYALITLLPAIYLSYTAADIQILFLFIINQILISYTFFQRSNISALHLFKTDAVFSILDKSIMILLSALLIWGNFIGFKLVYFVYLQSISYFLSAFIISIVVLSKSKPKQTIENHPETFKIIQNSLPYAMMVLLMTIYLRLDILLLRHLLPGGEIYAGIYAQSFRILEAASMFSILFAHWLLPIFTKIQSDSENLHSIVNLSFFVLLIFSTIISFGIFFYGNEMMARLYQHHAQESSQILSILIFSFIPISLNYIFGTLLTAAGKIKWLLQISLGGVIISIITNLLLIKSLHGIGTAIASNILHFSVAIVQLVISIRYFRIRLNKQKIKTYFVFLVGLILLGILIKQSSMVWIINFCIFVLLGILMAMALNIFNLKTIISLYKDK